MCVTAGTIFIGSNLEGHARWHEFHRSKITVILLGPLERFWQVCELRKISVVPWIFLAVRSNVFSKRTEGKTFRRSFCCINFSCFDFVHWIELWKLHRVHGLFIQCDTSNQQVHCSLGLPVKWTNEFSNWTCVFTRPTCVTFSLNKKFEATLTHDIHWISVFTNQGVHHRKRFNSTQHRH